MTLPLVSKRNQFHSKSDCAKSGKGTKLGTHEADTIEIKKTHYEIFSILAIFQYDHFTRRHLTLEQKQGTHPFYKMKFPDISRLSGLSYKILKTEIPGVFSPTFINLAF